VFRAGRKLMAAETDRALESAHQERDRELRG